MLAWDYTVLTYDRRGHARSRLLPGTDPAFRMEQQSAEGCSLSAAAAAPLGTAREGTSAAAGRKASWQCATSLSMCAC
jgi:hypothetical protein